ncbi:MAG: insulinase family protein [Ignavibacteriae bacterium]|nr:insulinase family protein [Ignavibacteriota bacterium]
MNTRLLMTDNRIRNTLFKKSLWLVALALSALVAIPAFAQKADRSKPPALGPAPSLKLPAIQHLKLSNDIPVVLMEKHSVPLVQVNLVINNAGSAMDPAGKSGLASLTADMMDEGAGKLNALQLADEIDFLGTNISVTAGMHTSGVSLHTPLGKFDQALPIMADILLRPTFPSEELERKTKELLTVLMQWHDEPRAIASVILNKTLFGREHPYGVPTVGNEESIRSFSADDLKRFHAAHFHAGNATFIVVGDISSKELLPKLEAAFGKWKFPASQKWPSWDPVKQVSERRIYLVDKPGAAQTEIRIGRIGVKRNTPDYFPLLVMNTILGGSFSSRLNQNLRETHGYSYGAGSRFDFRPLPGPFLAASAVQTNVTDKALQEFMNELNAILKPVTDDEMTRAKNYLALGYPEGFQSVGQIAGQLGEMVVYNLPDDYFNKYIPSVLAVTKADVERVAKKYLDPEKVAIILVGDRSVIEQGVRDLNLGQIDLLSIEDVLGKVPQVAN